MNTAFRPRLARLWHTAAAPRWAAPAIVTLGLLGAAAEGIGLYLFMPLVQTLSGADAGEGGMAALLGQLAQRVEQSQRLAWLVAAVAASMVIRSALGYGNYWLARYVDGLVAHRLRVRVFSQTLSSCIDYRVENRRTDIANTIANNCWNVAAALSLVYRLLVYGVTIALFTVLLLLLSVRLTLVAAVFLAVAGALVNLTWRRTQQLGRAVVEETKTFNLRMWEDVAGLRLIRSFAREAHESGRFEQSSERVRDRILQVDRLSGLPGPVAGISLAVLIGALILAGSRLGVGLAALTAFLALLYRLQGPVREVLSCKVALDSLSAAIDDVADYLEKTREPYLTGGSTRFAQLHDAVEFREVSFGYAAAEPLALERVSLRIPRGRTTAIVGRSGAGKSTLMDLLFRFRDPVAGWILVDGTPLPEFEIASWRERLAIMSQEVTLCHDSVAANIGYGRASAGTLEIREAARIAGAHEFIMALPQGYDTNLGDAGLRLSGGQRQRIALARTILRDPELLLLDEATNALDIESERFFQTALRDYARGRTVVVIAHRLSTVASADHIVLLDAGRVIESGSPQALLAAGGAFARLHDVKPAMAVGA